MLVRLTIAVLAALALAAPASAAQLVARNAKDVKIQVNAKGEALITYRQGRELKRMLAWGAINAIAPTQARAQVVFKVDYSGGFNKYKRAVWKNFPNVCGPYEGPSLPWFITACTAADGSHWALQAFQRLLKNYGLPSTGARAAWELHLSHWSGDLPVLEVGLNWAYRETHQVYGRFTYMGQPVYGFKSDRYGAPLDSFGRLFFLDTFNSEYGRGWKRDNSFLFHRPTGTFCYGLFARRKPYSPTGDRYRATANGPGVTPIVAWAAESPGPYNRELDLIANEEIRSYGDPKCRPN
ncbi:MAG: hypothetical protein WD689_02710 [Gaiellaceae bacterium]